MMMDGSLFCATLRTVCVKISKSVFSFLRTLTECHCPHLPAAVELRLCRCDTSCPPGPQQQTCSRQTDGLTLYRYVNPALHAIRTVPIIE